MELEKQPKEKPTVRGEGESKLQGSLFIIPVKIRNTESKALIDSGAQSNFITPRLVEEMKLKITEAPEVILNTITGEKKNANKKVMLKLNIGKEIVEVQLYVAEFTHLIILGSPFINQFSKEIDFTRNTVFGEKV